MRKELPDFEAFHSRFYRRARYMEREGKTSDAKPMDMDEEQVLEPNNP